MEFRVITSESERFVETIFAGQTAQYWVHYNRYWHQLALEKDDIEARLITVDEIDQPIGFIAYGQHYLDEALTQPKPGTYEIIHLVIDEPYQGRGFGREATQKTIALLATIDTCQAIVIAHHPDNIAAQKLYRSLGFVQIGTNYDGDPLLELRRA